MYALYVSMVQSVNYGSLMFNCAHWFCFVWFNARSVINITIVIITIIISFYSKMFLHSGTMCFR